jgi:hypothetical protein
VHLRPFRARPAVLLITAVLSMLAGGYGPPAWSRAVSIGLPLMAPAPGLVMPTSPSMAAAFATGPTPVT